MRTAVLLAGAGLLFFGWHQPHSELLTVQNPGTANAAGFAEILVVIGAFALLTALAPSAETRAAGCR